SSPRCRADQTRWIRRLGGERDRYRIARRADDLVRITMRRRDARPNRTPNGVDVDSLAGSGVVSGRCLAVRAEAEERGLGPCQAVAGGGLDLGAEVAERTVVNVCDCSAALADD